MKLPTYLAKMLVLNFQVSVYSRTCMDVQTYSSEIPHEQSLQKVNGSHLRELNFKGMENFAS